MKGDALLECRELTKTYRARRYGRWQRVTRALDNVSFSMSAGMAVAIIGRSGAGKTTLARCIAQMERPDSGEILLDGVNAKGSHRAQLVFQSTAAAMNPRFTVREVLEEPLRITGAMTRGDRREAAMAMLKQVGLREEVSAARPWQVSGGQKQRIGIGRALLMRPRLLVFDEGLAGLDSRSQEQIVELLADLQTLSLNYLFVTHDLRPLRSLVRRILIMEQGRLREMNEVTLPQAFG